MWRHKYTSAIEEAQLIKWNEQKNGSLIWNAIWQIAPSYRSMLSGNKGWQRGAILDKLLATTAPVATNGSVASSTGKYEPTSADQCGGLLEMSHTQ